MLRQKMIPGGNTETALWSKARIRPAIICTMCWHGCVSSQGKEVTTASAIAPCYLILQFSLLSSAFHIYFLLLSSLQANTLLVSVSSIHSSLLFFFFLSYLSLSYLFFKLSISFLCSQVENKHGSYFHCCKIAFVQLRTVAFSLWPVSLRLQTGKGKKG